jgi:hypothetical protein
MNKTFGPIVQPAFSPVFFDPSSFILSIGIRFEIGWRNDTYPDRSDLSATALDVELGGSTERHGSWRPPGCSRTGGTEGSRSIDGSRVSRITDPPGDFGTGRAYR